jgi:integrase/recombinase
MRSKELLTLKFKHFLKREDNYFFKLENTKSKKDVYKPIHPALVNKLADYKNYLKKIYNLDENELEEHFIFSVSVEENTPISYRALNLLVKEMGKLIQKDISPHNIRHAIATELSLNGADILEIRDFLGHSDTKVTEVYINAKSVLEKKVLDKLPDINLDD